MAGVYEHDAKPEQRAGLVGADGRRSRDGSIALTGWPRFLFPACIGSLSSRLWGQAPMLFNEEECQTEICKPQQGQREARPLHRAKRTDFKHLVSQVQ